VEDSGRHGAAEAHIVALAHQGNALRALGRLPDAARSFRQARNLLRLGFDSGTTRQAITDLGVSALVDWMEGAYFKEVCEFERAEELLTRAAILYALEENTAKVHQVVLSMAELFAFQGRIDDAIEAVSRVLASLAEVDNPRLYWMARFSHATYLTEAGLYDAASAELAAFRAASPELAGSYVKPRMQWVEGRIAFGLGELDQAERSFMAARRAYLAQESGINMALVSLDLALVYLHLRRPDKLSEIAEELALIFDANEVHREAAAALMLFQEAVRQETVNARYLDRLRRYLEAARHNPALQFEKPSQSRLG
jgi:tetratricopeptide (TPR) repeat protein